jgi:DNA-binding response OmpR family regulator
MSNILVIDDEESLRHTLGRVLRQAGYEVTTASDGNEALRLIHAGYEGASPYDVVYLDIRLPGMDGLQILKEIRQMEAAGMAHRAGQAHRAGEAQSHLPVILLTAYGSLTTALEALRLGATDYLLKPLDPEVLVARTRIILEEQAVERRRQEVREQIAALQEELRSLEAGRLTNSPPEGLPASGDRFFKSGPLILDLQARRATFREAVLALPPAAFDYLSVLARHAPDVIPYQTLVTEAQGYQADRLEARELSKWHIHAIRQALEPNPNQPRYLLNVRGTGYRLVVD